MLLKLESTAKEFGNARIVNASSSLHMACQELKFESLLVEKGGKCPAVLDATWRYGRRYVSLFGLAGKKEGEKGSGNGKGGERR